MLLEYYRLEKDFEGSIDLEPAEEGFRPITGEAGRKDKKKSPLTVIIDKINERYGTDFTEMDKVLLQIESDYEAQDKWHGYAQNNDFFANEPIKRMSKLTHNLLRAIDYPRVCGQRTENFAFLHRQLKEKNVLNLPPAIEGAYAYPFWFNGDKISGKEIRRRLIAQQIYIPMLWPEVCSLEKASPLERQMTENILPLPVDQRYSRGDMEEILGCLLRILEG